MIGAGENVPRVKTVEEYAAETMIRADERKRLAMLLLESAETIGDFAKDAESAVRIVGLMLDLAPGVDPDLEDAHLSKLMEAAPR